MDWLTNPDIWIGLVTLTFMEIVLGIDNLVFISILADKLPVSQQARARRVGLGLALFTRIGLLLTLTWVARLTTPLFTVREFEVSGRDLIFIIGGLFLLAKATREIHERLEGETGHASVKVAPSFSAVVFQIVLLDIVFSLDSVITAVGMVNQIQVMIAAVIIAILIMVASVSKISDFVNQHPTIKMLALSFLLLIGLMLLLEGLGRHIPKGYIYFAIGFSVFVEMLNQRASRKKAAAPVQLHQPYTNPDPTAH